ncbi:hypothetical protein BLNAU_1170 [Blattamonas nauphoetae]|uniref:Uncharacterized protein n=1 Tax=Blattamonas nauphoetae TaxID=2049346 RepID=A0ABQ9YIW1_9EUKA|nr:hypothetical protein BLNAU_1170 [Blattamonas nauphoetae]
MNPIQRTLASPPLPVGASSGLVRLVMRGTDEVQRHGQRARDDLQRRRVRLHGHLPDSQSVRHAIDVAKEFSEKTPHTHLHTSRRGTPSLAGSLTTELARRQMTSESTRATVATLLRSQSELCFPSPCSTHPPIAPRGKQDEPERKEEDKKDDSDNSDLIELDPKPKQENTTRPADLTRHPANNVFRCTSEEHRLSPNELDSDAEQQIGVVKQKDGSVDSSLKQELEQLVDTSASSASNADLLRIIDSLKATLVEVERQRSADKAKGERSTDRNNVRVPSSRQLRWPQTKHAGKEFGVDEAEDGDGAGEQHAVGGDEEGGG